MAKAKDAFRTISEVADWLDTPTHVLRFWESKFTQIKPVKGAGGRRYYRPGDMELLGGIKQLLHHDGLTIKGTQKLLREKGVKHVAGLGPSLQAPMGAALGAPMGAPGEDGLTDAPADVAPAPKAPAPAPPAPPAPADLVDPAEPAEDAQAMLPFILPEAAISRPGRLIGRAPLDPGAQLAANAALIAPLLARLRDLRQRMQDGV